METTYPLMIEWQQQIVLFLECLPVTIPAYVFPAYRDQYKQYYDLQNRNYIGLFYHHRQHIDHLCYCLSSP